LAFRKTGFNLRESGAMRRVLLPIMLLSVFAGAPVGAQIVGKPDYGPVPRTSPFLPDSRLPGPSVGQEVRQIRGEIDAARESGALGAREARQLDRQARLIGRLGARYGHGGLSDAERRELAARAAVLRAELQRQRR
jgi:hypothetical protein